MADQKDKIARYVTGLMEEDEELAFEVEMADDEDLRISVQLEKTRLANIQHRVKTVLQSEEGEKTDGTQNSFSFQTLRFYSWRRWAVAVAIVGLAIAVVWLFRPNDNTNAEQPEIEQPQKVDTPPVTPGPAKGVQHPTPSPRLPDHKKIAHDTYDRERPQAEILTTGAQDNPNVSTDTATQAYHAYLNGDSVMVYAYYEQHPNERRAVEWKARYLFEHNRHEEAAVFFARLKTFPKYEDVGAWNELLCYLAQYRTRKKDFDRLKEEVRKTKYKEDLERLLKQI